MCEWYNYGISSRTDSNRDTKRSLIPCKDSIDQRSDSKHSHEPSPIVAHQRYLDPFIGDLLIQNDLGPVSSQFGFLALDDLFEVVPQSKEIVVMGFQVELRDAIGSISLDACHDVDKEYIFEGWLLVGIAWERLGEYPSLVLDGQILKFLENKVPVILLVSDPDVL